MISLSFDTFTVGIIGLLIDKFNIDDMLELIIEKEPLILKFGEYGKIIKNIESFNFDDILYFRTEEDMALFKLRYNV